MVGARKAVVLLPLLAVSFPAMALPEDNLRPYVEYLTFHDSNYFRLANDGQALALLGTTNTAATIRRIGVGLDADLKLSRQALVLRTNLNQTSFDRRELQNQSGGSVLARWNWALGHDLTGELSARKTRDLLSQTDLNSLGANVQETRRTTFDAKYHLHPSFSLNGGIGRYAISYSNPARVVLDRDDKIASLGWLFQSRFGSQFGMEYLRTDGQYPNPAATVNHYEQSELNLQGGWSPGGLSRIRGQAGYTRRKEGQFVLSQPTWRLSADWNAGGKATLSASVQRRVQTSDTVTSSTANVSDSADVNAAWNLTAKTALTASVRELNWKYPSISRTDRLHIGSVGLSYQPDRSVLFGLAYESGQRNSNLDAADFRYRTVTASLRAAF